MATLPNEICFYDLKHIEAPKERSNKVIILNFLSFINKNEKMSLCRLLSKGYCFSNPKNDQRCVYRYLRNATEINTVLLFIYIFRMWL